MRSDSSRSFRLVSAVVACYLLASSVNAPYVLVSASTHPYRLASKVEKVKPPVTAEGLLYDRTTGLILYDAVTLRPIYA
jgi:hypothetical protein